MKQLVGAVTVTYDRIPNCGGVRVAREAPFAGLQPFSALERDVLATYPALGAWPAHDPVGVRADQLRDLLIALLTELSR